MEFKRDKRNIKQFNGDRYSVWKFRVKSLLGELSVLHVVDADIPAEPSEEWNKQNSTAKSAIVEYLSDSFLSFAKEKQFAKDILASLDIIYERRSLATQLASRKKLLSLKLEGDKRLLQHFTLFDETITELIAAGAQLDEMDKVSHLLLTLPPTYDGVITALETLSEDNLNLAFVKTRLLDHEVKLQQENSSTSAKVLNASGPYRPPQTKQQPFSARFKGQKRRNKMGFQRNQQPKYKHSNIKCDHCGRTNHVKKDCYFYKRMCETERDRPRTIQTVRTNSGNADGFAFMVGSPNYHLETSNESEIMFLLDSGATDHIVNQVEVFTTLSDLPAPLHIAVAKTGTSVTATKTGTINVITNVGENGTLQGVLYSADVPYNLLSVRRIQESGMAVIFDSEGVKVMNGQKTILTGEQLADIFTKTLPVSKFKEIRMKIGLI